MDNKRGVVNKIMNISKSVSSHKLFSKKTSKNIPSIEEINAKLRRYDEPKPESIIKNEIQAAKFDSIPSISLSNMQKEDVKPLNIPKSIKPEPIPSLKFPNTFKTEVKTVEIPKLPDVKNEIKQISRNDNFITNIRHNIDISNVNQNNETSELQKELKDCLYLFDSIRGEIGNVVVGQKEIVDAIILALMCNGHCLIEGVPGIGKTLTVRAISKILNCQYSRIQFTPDLLPSDIVGITAYDEKRGFYTVKGPIFANFILADEINRAPPKVQSALLESMQERQATIGKETFKLPSPFFVMATQNPVETLGTYALPEAQVDRFLFKIIMKYPNKKEEALILSQNMTLFSFDSFDIKSFFTPDLIKQVQDFVKDVYLDKKIEDYIVRLIDCTRNPKEYKLKTAQYLSFGASPRGTIALFIASKGRAFLNGRTYVTPQDVKEVAHLTLRHRITLNYEGQAEEIKVDDVIDEILSVVSIH